VKIKIFDASAFQSIAAVLRVLPAAKEKVHYREPNRPYFPHI